ncbi:MAG: methionyl-tRNA formyltransferase [Acidimicrobiales bacterium]
MRLAYLGTPEMAVPPLQALVDAGHDVALVVTRPDKRRHRRGHDEPSPVKAAALDLGLPVTARIDDVLDLEPPAELGVVAAFGRIIKPHVLDALPMVNLHFSLLPRWRGAAPVERAILAGDETTGVCLMAVEEGLDTGGVYRCEEAAIGPEETAAELRRRLVDIASKMVVDALAAGFDTLGEPQPQQGEAAYADKIDPAELHTDWTRPPVEIHRLVRIGGAWTTHHGRRLKVWRSRLTPDGELELLEVQPEGKARMSFRDWANGARWHPGDPLGT